jgi:hypothetical protein
MKVERGIAAAFIDLGESDIFETWHGKEDVERIKQDDIALHR